ncbi:MAG: peptidoglycan-binding protein [Leeuwenhoekiella sp.]
MAVLRLGSYDRGKKPLAIAEFLKPYHRGMATALRNKLQFRDEANFSWRSFKEETGDDIRRLQGFLKKNGFFPNAQLSGIFGYGTQAATRLFQEYVLNVEGEKSIGTPDGVVGSKTWYHVDRWERDKINNLWSTENAETPSQEFLKWHKILKDAKGHYTQDENTILSQVRNYPEKSDTFLPENWNTDSKEVHLLGIRRAQDKMSIKRPNDDLFILLICGMVFKFWGSTDPSASMAGRPDEAFLVEGQHKYRMSWHKVSSSKKVYKALRPYSKGVLVYRDRDDTNALTNEDIKAGLDVPNTTINIHWSGDGRTNFSAGCQVIAGKSYIAPDDKMIDCTDYASISYGGLANGKTRGAYNVLSDLVVCFNELNRETVWYTLGREENLETVAKEFSADYLENLLTRLKRH